MSTTVDDKWVMCVRHCILLIRNTMVVYNCYNNCNIHVLMSNCPNNISSSSSSSSFIHCLASLSHLHTKYTQKKSFAELGLAQINKYCFCGTFGAHLHHFNLLHGLHTDSNSYTSIFCL